MIEANRQCLHQALTLLDALTDLQYTDRRGDWSPVGSHYRHIVEHYRCLLDGLPAGQIDYDARPRDATIELSRERARQVTIDLLGAVDALGDWPMDRSLAVRMQCRADDPRPCWAQSTLGRELQLLVSHSVHHFALIKFLLANDVVSLGEDFGLAPSTVSHGRAVR